ncbi:uncharacterized protein LOC131241476 isoform X4 [Magnolia sinica]|uniref:uncharacterized protein LOC131241476 isoform X4 n=1 Tax=Magnolia sinica TaxID=86752 RepID=UPI002657B292|nr:uncharacterized protein LOC131241476 isoform X4 [Magnolia sinica]
MSMLQSLNNVSLASSILVSTLASPFTLAMHLLNLPKLYNLFAGILMSTFDMKDESKEVIWQGEIGGVYAALDTFKAEKAFPMCKLTRLLRDSLGLKLDQVGTMGARFVQDLSLWELHQMYEFSFPLKKKKYFLGDFYFLSSHLLDMFI